MRYAIAVELFGGAVIEAMIVEAPDPESAILMAAEHGNVISTPSRIESPVLSENLREAVAELGEEILCPQDDLRLGIMLKASRVVDLLKGML